MSPIDRLELNQYVATRDEAAFASLVSRHAARVFGVALRQTRDRHRAEDVAQATFLLLAQRAKALLTHTNLSGWLHVTTVQVAANANRSERRRRRREAAMREDVTLSNAANTSDDKEIDPELWASVDRAVAALRERDREILARRFFDGESVADIAASRNESNDAIKKRLTRALDRVRDRLAAQGIVAGTSLPTLLAMPPVPVDGLVSAGCFLSGGAMTASGKTLAANTLMHLKRMWLMKMTAAITGALVMIGGVTLARQSAAPRVISTPPRTAAQAPSLKASVPGDVTFEVVAIRREHSAHNEPVSAWFAPNGSLLPEGDLRTQLEALPKSSISTGWILIARIGSRADEDFGWTSTRVLPFSTRGGMWVLSSGRLPEAGTPTTSPSVRVERLYRFNLGGIPTETTCDLQFRLSTGDFTRIAAIDTTDEPIHGPDDMNRVSVQWSGVTQRDGTTFISATHYEPTLQTKVVAIDIDGNAHQSQGDGRRGLGMSDEGRAVFTSIGGFRDLPIERIERFELHARPKQTVTLYNVALVPGQATTPRVATDADAPSPASQEPLEAIDLSMSLGEAIEALAGVSEISIEVGWDGFADYQSFTRESPVSVRLANATPPTALRAIFESAGARDFTVAVSPDGRKLYVRPGAFQPTFGNFNALDPRRLTPGLK